MTATQIATLHTSAGDIRILLFGNHAPKTVRNFVELASGAR
ncbi:MAG: peptidyl-prolyl cis-trans isomerase, partial [Pseudonocardiales bacterium]|nr:peptidyl-prolyl cis-trans isomerase [Pseudonocardiales bacterium]